MQASPEQTFMLPFTFDLNAINKDHAENNRGSKQVANLVYALYIEKDLTSSGNISLPKLNIRLSLKLRILYRLILCHVI
ncbi:hypothetical protein CK934_16640 [Chitinophaga sp. MD30]|nr:hypothetical protein CK934_16640 [Chitinophaga sp. MD30]